MNKNLKIELEEIFKKLDKDSNGFIDKDEFSKLLVTMGKDKELSEEQWKVLFSLFDTNNDGKIDFIEFKAGIETKLPDM